MEIQALAVAQPGDKIRGLQHLGNHFLFLLLRYLEGLERARQGADAASHAGRQNLRQHREKRLGVIQACGLMPRGSVNLLLHAGSMKLPVGKSIDREDIAVMLLQPPLKMQTRFPLAERAHRLCPQPQTNGIRLTRGDTTLHLQGVGFQRQKRFRPGLAAVDVGAVG